MQVSYGPPGHKGVSHLMAVGADELPPSDTDRAVRWGGLAGAALAAFGMATGSKRAFHLGLGALAAIGGVYWAGRRTRGVLVTT